MQILYVAKEVAAILLPAALKYASNYLADKAATFGGGRYLGHITSGLFVASAAYEILTIVYEAGRLMVVRLPTYEGDRPVIMEDRGLNDVSILTTDVYVQLFTPQPAPLLRLSTPLTELEQRNTGKLVENTIFEVDKDKIIPSWGYKKWSATYLSIEQTTSREFFYQKAAKYVWADMVTEDAKYSSAQRSRLKTLKARLELYEKNGQQVRSSTHGSWCAAFASYVSGFDLVTRSSYAMYQRSRKLDDNGPFSVRKALATGRPMFLFDNPNMAGLPGRTVSHVAVIVAATSYPRDYRYTLLYCLESSISPYNKRDEDAVFATLRLVPNDSLYSDAIRIMV